MFLNDEDYMRVLSTMPIVCVDWLVLNELGEFLLVRRNNQLLKGEFWVTGGRVHKSEKLESTVHRKLFDEIGVAVNVVRLMGFSEEFFSGTKQKADGGVHAISFLY